MNLPKNDKIPRVTHRATRTVGILLLPDFPMMAYACVVEPLRAANILAGRKLYNWVHLSTDGKPAPASNGITIAADAAIDSASQLDMLMVCAGGNPSSFRNPAVSKRLRQMSRRGTAIGGVSGGPFILGRAGLLDGYRCTIHWEHFPAFVEEFPDAHAERSLFVIDRDRLTCAGGISALDMMHALIEVEHGHDLAAAVSEWFLQTQIRAGSGPQKMSARERFDVKNPALLRVLEYMEARIETPASRQQLAKIAGLSTRQLERLFASQLGLTIGDHYLAIRLERARILLRQTSQPVLAIAVAAGFVTATHFSREYRKRYGVAPSQDRSNKEPTGNARRAAKGRRR